MKRTIIIMAKVPLAGNVKTRLQPFLSSEQCAALAEAFLFDTINKVRIICDKLIVAYAPRHKKNYFDGMTGENLTIIGQSGANLGDKMFNAFEFAFGINSDAKVLTIGTDSPTFPTEFLEQAFDALESNSEIVLGESEDGGFYLIGLRRILPRIFDNIQWSSSLVYEQVLRNIEKSKNNFKLIPIWYDVDNPADLLRLRDEILKDEQAQKLAPLTYQWITTNSEIFRPVSNSFLVSELENKF